MWQTLRADSKSMSEKNKEEESKLHIPQEGREDVVAAAAARILAEADRAIDTISAESERVPENVRAAGDALRKHGESDTGAEENCVGVRADLREDRAKINEIDDDLEEVQAELGPIKSGIIGLQNHSLRSTGAAALVLAVLLAIAWKVIGG
jgi:hypothetical protein